MAALRSYGDLALLYAARHAVFEFGQERQDAQALRADVYGDRHRKNTSEWATGLAARRDLPMPALSACTRILSMPQSVICAAV